MATAGAIPQERARQLDRAEDHRRPQPSGAADNGGGRLSYPTTGALADRGVVGGGMAGGWVTYGAATGG